MNESAADVVRARVPTAKRRAFLLRLAAETLPADKRTRFVAMAEQELDGVNEVTLPRYGLRPSEWEAWREQR